MPTSEAHSWFEIIVPAFTILGAVIAASASYYFGRKQQVEEEQRKVKVEVYEEFYRTFLDVARDPSIDHQKKFSLIYNRLLFVGSDDVVQGALAWWAEMTAMGNTAPIDSLSLKGLLDTMRKDLGISRRPVLSRSSFIAITWKT